MKILSPQRLHRLLPKWILIVGLVLGAWENVLAQGGPPLVTDDPETPGDGHWEVNLAATGDHTSGRWQIAAG